MNYLSLLLPLAYLSILIGSLATFSHFYRRQQTLSKQRLEAWFPTHLSRDIYLSLLELQAQPDTKVPDSVLKAALLRRAIEDIHRLISLKNQKPALTALVQRGSVGDELMTRFQIAEKEMDLEVRDVVNEANALAPQQGWGQVIFQSASEMAHKEMFEKKLAAIEETRAEMKSEWEGRRKRVAEGFAKELEGVDNSSVGSGTAASVDEDEKPRSKDGSSDEDLVKIDAGETRETEQGSPGSAGGGASGKKKKRGKN